MNLGWQKDNEGNYFIAVDTHIFRLANRTKFAPSKNVVEVEEKMLKVVPAEFKVDVHHWFILHGRYTCLARKPRCGSCIIEDLCIFSKYNYTLKKKSILKNKPKRISLGFSSRAN